MSTRIIIGTNISDHISDDIRDDIRDDISASTAQDDGHFLRPGTLQLAHCHRCRCTCTCPGA